MPPDRRCVWMGRVASLTGLPNGPKAGASYAIALDVDKFLVAHGFQVIEHTGLAIADERCDFLG